MQSLRDRNPFGIDVIITHILCNCASHYSISSYFFVASLYNDKYIESISYVCACMYLFYIHFREKTIPLCFLSIFRLCFLDEFFTCSVFVIQPLHVLYMGRFFLVSSGFDIGLIYIYIVTKHV